MHAKAFASGQTGDRRRVLQQAARDLGWIDNPRLHQIGKIIAFFVGRDSVEASPSSPFIARLDRVSPRHHHRRKRSLLGEAAAQFFLLRFAIFLQATNLDRELLLKRFRSLKIARDLRLADLVL